MMSRLCQAAAHAWLAALLLLLVPCGVWAAAGPEELLPPAACAGWKLEGKPQVYDRDTLSERIDGEAELFFPYGFQRMAAARYLSGKDPAAGIDVEIFRLGSLLDAFGMYANYRPKDARPLAICAEGSLAGSQLFLYQGPYFLQIQITGSETIDPGALEACGKAVAARLPGGGERPAELSVLDRPDLVKGSERFLPESLLGYDFLNRGLLAEAALKGANLQVFLLLGTTADSAALALERYRSQLTGAKSQPLGKDAIFLEGVDPLYGPVALLRKGSCLAGVLKYSREEGIREFLVSFCK